MQASIPCQKLKKRSRVARKHLPTSRAGRSKTTSSPHKVFGVRSNLDTKLGQRSSVSHHAHSAMRIDTSRQRKHTCVPCCSRSGGGLGRGRGMAAVTSLVIMYSRTSRTGCTLLWATTTSAPSSLSSCQIAKLTSRSLSVRDRSASPLTLLRQRPQRSQRLVVEL